MIEKQAKIVRLMATQQDNFKRAKARSTGCIIYSMRVGHSDAVMGKHE